MLTGDELFPVITVHCFFNCGHTVRELDPVRAHDVMEEHYTAVHQPQIRAITGRLRWTVIPGATWEMR